MTHQEAVNGLEGERWYRVHHRWRSHPGCIIDIGCLGWDWSGRFKDRRVIGYDPFEESSPEWAQLQRKIITPKPCGQMVIAQNALASTTWANDGVLCDTVPIEQVLQDEPSIVKLNIEGDEYSLLHSHPHPWSDQLVVAFHDWLHPMWNGLSMHYVSWLSQWYMPIQTDTEWTWWLFLKK